jgi:hypothetical protein
VSVCAPPIMLSFSVSVRAVRNIRRAAARWLCPLRGWRSTRRVPLQTLSARDKEDSERDREDYYEVANEREREREKKKC